MLVPEGFSTLDRLARVLDELDETVFLAEVEPGPTLRFTAVVGRTLRAPDGCPVDAVGRRVDEVLGAAGAERAYHWWLESLRTGTTQHYLGDDHDADGRPRTVEVTVFPWGNGEQVAGIVRDVTAEHDALRRVTARDDFNRAVLDAIATSTAVIDQRGRVHMVNAPWVVDATDPSLTVALPGDDFLCSIEHVPGAAAACNDILGGGGTPFSADYLDHNRWFNLRIVPFDFEPTGGAIVTRSEVTDRVQEQQGVQRLHQRWEAAFASASIGMGIIGPDDRYVLVNRQLCELLGRTEEEMLAIDPRTLRHPDDEPGPQRPSPGAAGIERRYLRGDGSVLWAWLTWSAVEDEEGDHFFIQIKDIGPRKRMEARLRDHQDLLELVASGALLEVVLRKIADVGEAHLPGSRWVLAVTGSMGWSEEVTSVGVDEEHAADLSAAYRTLAPTHWRKAQGVIVIPPGGGTPLAAALRLGGAWVLPVVEEGGHVSGFIVVHNPPGEPDDDDLALVEQMGSVVRIVLQRDAATRRLAERLLEDSLTGLPNRTLFHTRAQQAIDRIGHGSRGIALVSADLDRFGRVNESLGHLAGDHVLVEIGRRLRGAVPSPDTVARGGGDEFLVLLEDVASADAAMEVANRLLTTLRQPIVVDGVEFLCPASIGVAFHAEGNRTVETLEGDAALAMEAAKARGRDRAELFTHHLRTAMPRLSFERELRQAVADEQFVVYFQPEVDLSTNRIVGVEALVRWDHPERGLLPPADFIGTAESIGVIVDIGRLVLAEACARLAEWAAHTDEPLTVAVNLSARQLADPTLVEFVETTLQEHGIDPTRLVLEMTESTLVDDGERARDVFEALRHLGVSVAIDDFGTGYSSLLYLKRFPADVLKIDRSFVDGLGHDPGDSAIVAAVVRLAHRLDLSVIAEGVETPEQLAHLRRLGCEVGQGYLWSRPRSAEGMVELLGQPLPDIPAVPVGPLEPGDADRSELDELLAVLTHELSTPLTVIGGYAEMLADRLHAEDDGARTGVAAIERNVHNLGRLVAALADARGLGSGGDTVQFDAVPFVEQTLADLAPILTAHDLDVRLETPAAVIAADPVGLGQILTNLVGNATKFTEPGDPIEVVVGRDDGTLAIAVVDHGPGIPPDRLDELFGRFARLGSSRRGLGLGLYLSRSIARRHGGDVVHRSTPGGGATFVVTFPSCPED